MNPIKWDEQYFEQSGLYIWIYNKGLLESTNEKYSGANLSNNHLNIKQKSVNNNLKTENITD